MRAMELNVQAHYMEAYETLKSLQKDLSDAAEKEGFTIATVPQHKDFLFYLSILSSEAQCAYKLNLGDEILDACSELEDNFYERGTFYEEYPEDCYWILGVASKALGDYYYVSGARMSLYYSEAQSAYESAVNFFGLAEDKGAVAKVYAEMAQVAYAQELYEDALDYIEKAIGNTSERRAVGSNARESFTAAEAQVNDVIYQSAKAMCLARNHEFRTALHVLEDVMDRLPKGDKRLPELKRRKAKILLLQHEENGTDVGPASELYEAYFKAIKDSVNANFLQMTADLREEYWMVERPFVVDCYQLEDRNPELLYDVTLYNKGMLLQTSRSFDNLLYDSTSKGKPDERGQLNALRQQDAQNAFEGHDTNLAADYERQLLRTMTADGRRKRFFTALNHTWRDVQKALPKDGCAIEFVEYEKESARHFATLVLHKTGRPQFVYVCNADELSAYEPRSSFFSLGTLLGQTNGNMKNYIYTDQELPDYIWTPTLRSAIGESQKVYFSTDGYLHQLAIEYLLPKELQGRNFYRLSSTRVLVDGRRLDADRVKNGKAFVLGGIMYKSDFVEDTTTDAGNDAEAFKVLRRVGASFVEMEGAQIECDSIIYYRNNPDDLYLKDLQATERAFYEHCGEYPLLHLSTHGCFIGDNSVYDELLPSSTKDVLSESTMALSFAESHLRDSNFDGFNKDGLLSAREVARLNLENVELVTTSACQTGLGYITADGVYGMQRGFKSAGAKAMVMTLWSVNIESARIFFTTFYRYLAEGESVHKAFNHARNDLLTKEYELASYLQKFSAATMSSRPTSTPITMSFAAPYHSCPYILIDAWE